MHSALEPHSLLNSDYQLKSIVHTFKQSEQFKGHHKQLILSLIIIAFQKGVRYSVVINKKIIVYTKL